MDIVLAKTKHLSFIALILLSLNLILTACAAKPTEPVLADSFFSGGAFLDANGNGQLDSADTPLQNANFIVTLQGGYEFGDLTDEKGNAFITIPSSVEYPVTLRMEAPKGSSLKLIGPSSVTFPSTTGETTKFLFAVK